MKAVVIEAPETVVYKDVPDPVAGPKDVVVKIGASGICGTDIHIYHGGFMARFPLIAGHEYAGTTVDVGKVVRDLKIGQAVALDGLLPCGECYFCKTLRYNHCLNWRGLGVTDPGGFAQYAVVPSKGVFPLTRISIPEAAMTEPLACVVYGLRRLQVPVGANVLIFGTGPMGMLMTQMVKHGNAASVTVCDLQAHRLEMARSLGADVTVLADGTEHERLHELAPLGFDVVIEVTGNPQVVQRMFEHVMPTGKIMIFGVSPEDGKITVSPYDIFRRDLQIIGSFSICNTHAAALQLLESGAVNVKPLISHTLPLARFEEGLHLAMNRAASLKVQFDPWA